MSFACLYNLPEHAGVVLQLWKCSSTTYASSQRHMQQLYESVSRIQNCSGQGMVCHKHTVIASQGWLFVLLSGSFWVLLVVSGKTHASALGVSPLDHKQFPMCSYLQYSSINLCCSCACHPYPQFYVVCQPRATQIHCQGWQNSVGVPNTLDLSLRSGSIERIWRQRRFEIHLLKSELVRTAIIRRVLLSTWGKDWAEFSPT